MQKGFAGLALILGMLAIGGAVVGMAFYLDKVNLQKITDFDSCVKAGNPALESYPAQCNTKDGRHFVQQISEEKKKKLVPPSSESGQAGKKYESEKLGVEFILPENSYIYYEGPKLFSDGSFYSAEIGVIYRPKGINMDEKFSIWRPIWSGLKNLKECDEGLDECKRTVRQFSIDGQNATEIEYINKKNSSGGEHILVASKELDIERFNNVRDRGLVDELISSIKFLK